MKLTKLMKLKPYFELLRFSDQWFKSLFVLFPLFFSQQFYYSQTVLLALAAVGIFILASGSVYALNDLLDASFDKLHPKKRLRPLPRKAISPFHVFLFWVALTALTLSVSAAFFLPFFFIILIYLIMTMLYSLYLKKIVFLDVIMIALGFVFRVIGGGVAIGVQVTDWMIVLVFLFTLFIAISKRRQEIKNLEEHSHKTRTVLTVYTIELIDQLNAIIVPIVITSYIVYTFSERPNNPYFIASIPLVIYCFFRYLYFLKHTDFGASSKDYISDPQLVALGIIWFVLIMAGLS